MVEELLKGVGHWSESAAQYVFTPRNFQDYMRGLESRTENQYDEYF